MGSVFSFTWIWCRIFGDCCGIDERFAGGLIAEDAAVESKAQAQGADSQLFVYFCEI